MDIKKIIQNSFEIQPKKADYLPKIDINYQDFEQAIRMLATVEFQKRFPAKSFQFTPEQQKFIQYFHKYITKTDFPGFTEKGILLTGGFGTGKTLILKSIFNFFQILSDKRIIRKTARFITAIEIQDLIQAQNFEKYNSYKNGIVAIDDIGKDESVVNVYGSKFQPIRRLLDYRYSNNSLTFGTTNYKLETLEKKYGAYIGSRLFEMFNIYEFKGQDLRKNYKL